MKKINTLAQIFHTFYEHKITLQNFSELTPTLEDVFLSIIAEREEKSHGN